MKGIFSRLAIVWRIASPYFSAEDRWPGRILLAAVIAIELSIVGITVLINEWNARFYNALQDRNWNAFVYQLGLFLRAGDDLHPARRLSALPQSMAADPLAALADRKLSRPLDGGRQSLSHAAPGRRRRQPGPAHLGRHRAIHRLDAVDRTATAQFLRHAVLVHDHFVVVVGGGAAARVRGRLRYSGLPVVGGVDLCLHRHGIHTSDRQTVNRA